MPSHHPDLRLCCIIVCLASDSETIIIRFIKTATNQEVHYYLYRPGTSLQTQQIPEAWVIGFHLEIAISGLVSLGSYFYLDFECR